MDSINGQYVSNGVQRAYPTLFAIKAEQMLDRVREEVQLDAFFGELAKGHQYPDKVKGLLHEWDSLVRKSRQVLETVEDGHANVLTRFVIETLATAFGNADRNRGRIEQEINDVHQRVTIWADQTLNLEARIRKLEELANTTGATVNAACDAATAEQPGTVVQVDEPSHNLGKLIDAAPLSKTRRSAAAKKAWKARKAKAAAVKKLKARKPAPKKKGGKK